MKRLSLVWGGGWLLCTQTVLAAPVYDSTYTSLMEADCRTIEVVEEGGSSVQDCQPFRGIGVRLMEGDLRQSITLLMGGKEHPLGLWQLATGFNYLGDVLEWRHIKGRPDQLAGMIVRLNESEDPGHPEKVTSYLLVSKVLPDGACVVAKVPPYPDGSQNRQARNIAEGAAQAACLAVGS